MDQLQHQLKNKSDYFPTRNGKFEYLFKKDDLPAKIFPSPIDLWQISLTLYSLSRCTKGNRYGGPPNSMRVGEPPKPEKKTVILIVPAHTN